jgi:hypothetical protein
MTEDEWMATRNPPHMISSGLTAWTDRKAHLAASHCLRHWWHMLTEVQKSYVEVVEQLSSGEGNAEEAQILRLNLKEANSHGQSSGLPLWNQRQRDLETGRGSWPV